MNAKDRARKCQKCRRYQPPDAFAPTYRGHFKTDRRNVCADCERKRKREAYARRAA